jgi:vacuolar protein sorting-associated protein VTA1
MAKAQKHCKYATSALNYDDVETAITNLEECLRILKTGK